MSSPTPNDPSRRGWLNSKELLMLFAGLLVICSGPILVGQIFGLPVRKALFLAFALPHKESGLLVIPVWLVGLVLLLRNRRPGQSLLPVIAIGGLLATSVIHGVLSVWIIGSRTPEKLPVVMWIAEVGPSILSAVFWVLLTAALIGRNRTPDSAPDPSATADDNGTESPSRTGHLVVCLLTGAAAGFLLNAVTDDINSSPYRLLIYTVGGCMSGIVFSILMNRTSRPQN